MSDKNLLNENTIRRFMKLANVDTMTDNFISEMGKAYKKEQSLEEGIVVPCKGPKGSKIAHVMVGDDCLPCSDPEAQRYHKKYCEDAMAKKNLEEALEEEVVEESTEEEVVEEEIDLTEEEDEEEPEEEMEMDAELGDMPGMDDEEPADDGDADISLTEEEAQLLIDLGERLQAAMGAEEGPEMDMGDEPAMDDEPEMDMSDEPEMDMEDEEDEEMMQEAIVNEVLKRVTQRIVREKMSRK